MYEQDTIAIPVGLAAKLVDLADEFRPYLKNEGEAETVAVPGQGDWTREMLERLRKQIVAYPAAVALLDLAAENPDKPVLYWSVVDRAGDRDQERQVRAELGAMTKLTSKLFGRRTWPLRTWQNASDGQKSYQMPRRIAEWWLDR